MDKAVHLKELSISDTLKQTDVQYELLHATALQIVVHEALQALGLVCSSTAIYLNGNIANAYAKKRLTLEQALLLAYHLDLDGPLPGSGKEIIKLAISDQSKKRPYTIEDTYVGNVIKKFENAYVPNKVSLLCSVVSLLKILFNLLKDLTKPTF